MTYQVIRISYCWMELVQYGDLYLVTSGESFFLPMLNLVDSMRGGSSKSSSELDRRLSSREAFRNSEYFVVVDVVLGMPDVLRGGK